MINQSKLKKLFKYDKKGFLIWKTRPAQRIHIGDRAGFVSRGSKYKLCRIEGKTYRYSHLIWCYHYGFFPEVQIKHKNGNTLDNRITNLQLRDIPIKYIVHFKRETTNYYRVLVPINNYQKLNQRKKQKCLGCRKSFAEAYKLLRIWQSKNKKKNIRKLKSGLNLNIG